jgi:hypothetical protein
MAGEQILHLHSSGPSPEPLKIKVERGAKGGFAFEVSLHGANETEMISRIKAIYASLDAEFCPKAPEA